MTEVECEISTQTFKRRRPALHQLGCLIAAAGNEREVNGGQKKQIGLKMGGGRAEG